MSATNRHKMGNENDECSQRIRSYKNTRHGTPEGTRTPDLLIRSQSLYPTELLAHKHSLLNAGGIITHPFGKCKHKISKIAKNLMPAAVTAPEAAENRHPG